MQTAPFSSAWTFHLSASSKICIQLKELILALSRPNRDFVSGARTASKIVVNETQLCADDTLLITPFWHDQALSVAWNNDYIDSIKWPIGKCYSAFVEHTAIVLNSGEYLECLRRLHQLFRIRTAYADQDSSGVTRQNLDFMSITVDGMDINVVSANDCIPHLAPFLGHNKRGGVFHIGVEVECIKEAVSFCRSRQILLLGDQIKRLACKLPKQMLARFGSILDQGYAEECLNDGYLRQTFVYFSALPGVPFMELVERHKFSGYGRESPATLIDALDAVALG